MLLSPVKVKIAYIQIHYSIAMYFSVYIYIIHDNPFFICLDVQLEISGLNYIL